MHRLVVLFKILVWVGIIVAFSYYPGDVRIKWIGYDVQTSIFFLFAVLFIVDRFFAILGKIDRYLFHDLGKNLKLSSYKSKIKSLKKSEQKLLEKEKKEKAELKKARRQQRRDKWHNLGNKIRNIFSKKKK